MPHSPRRCPTDSNAMRGMRTARCRVRPPMGGAAIDAVACNESGCPDRRSLREAPPSPPTLGCGGVESAWSPQAGKSHRTRACRQAQPTAAPAAQRQQAGRQANAPANKQARRQQGNGASIGKGKGWGKSNRLEASAGGRAIAVAAAATRRARPGCPGSSDLRRPLLSRGRVPPALLPPSVHGLNVALDQLATHRLC